MAGLDGQEERDESVPKNGAVVDSSWVVVGPEDDGALAAIMANVTVGLPKTLRGNDDYNDVPGITMIVTSAEVQKFLAKQDELESGLVLVDEIGGDQYRVTLPLGSYIMSGGGCRVFIDSEGMGERDLDPKTLLGFAYSSIVSVHAFKSDEKWKNENYRDDRIEE